LAVQKIGNTEITLQLKMRPMVEGIANRCRNRPGKSEKLIVVAGVTSDEPFGHAICPHRSPFVMIPIAAFGEPDLG
jgi:hypothetical protein